MHFTYLESFERDNLRQGDLLRITSELSKILRKTHPNYLKDDYKYFLVLTQSCDLLRRDGKPCNAKYISLAAVRPFDLVIQREASLIQRESFEKKGGICRLNRKSKLIDFMNKLLNNNHKEFFYLHEEAELGLKESCCAFLRLSIAFRSSEHYENCLESKFIELTDEFRAKLGWLVGDLYSRIGTRDWADYYNLTKKDFKRKVDDILKNKFVWFEPEIMDELKKYFHDNQVNLESLNEDEIKKIAFDIQLPAKEEKKKIVLKSIERILSTSKALAKGTDIEKLLLKIEDDAIFKSNIK
jgi:hypothetical protein